MVRFPYYTDHVDDSIKLSNTIVAYSHLIVFATFVASFTSVSPGFAADTAGTIVQGANSTQNRSISAIVFLAALDTAACNKGFECLNVAKDKVVEKASSNPKFITTVVCTGAVVWCARGVTEKIINKHL